MDGEHVLKIRRFWKAIQIAAFRGFPERQIYLRSAGKVQYFSLSSLLQAICVVLALLVLGWTAYATVLAIFKDEAVAARDARYRQTRLAYENRLTMLQQSTEGLAFELGNADHAFRAVGGSVVRKQNLIAGLLARSVANEAVTGTAEATFPNELGMRSAQDVAPVYIFSPSRLATLSREGEESSSDGAIVPALPPLGERRVLDQISAVSSAWIASLLAPAPSYSSNVSQGNKGLAILAREIGRLRSLDDSESEMLTEVQMLLSARILNTRSLIQHTGIDPVEFLRKISVEDAVGGPEIPLEQVQLEGISDSRFTRSYLSASALLDKLSGLFSAIRHIPLAWPVGNDHSSITSSFGPRMDPVTGRISFHPGLDFAGAWGTEVVATAPGIVTYAGARGSYGNLVEIDHGLGLHTRYAHLSRLLVRLGVRVAEGTVIGKLGSTGRSTGPHVHYEVWYENVVRNPTLFIQNAPPGAVNRSVRSTAARLRSED